MANPFVHVELHTNDLAKAKQFYTRLFGWKLQDVPMPGSGGTYTLIDVGGGTGGGMLTNPTPGAPSHWMSYVGVDDLEASTKKARELGAKVLLEVTEVGSFGWMSVISDPTGATVAMWKGKSQKS
jgi:predicted enzyme related to lactoylglutathione lyase